MKVTGLLLIDWAINLGYLPPSQPSPLKREGASEMSDIRTYQTLKYQLISPHPTNNFQPRL